METRLLLNLADIGLPMVFPEVALMLAALVPVILVEMWVAKRVLKREPKTAWLAITVANLVSTLVGFPVLWLLLVFAEFASGAGHAYGLSTFHERVYAVTVQAPWVIPYEGDFYWMVPLAALYLLVPAFFCSVFLERWICRLFWPTQDGRELKRFSWLAHLASYAVLAAYPVYAYLTSVPPPGHPHP